MGKSLVRWTFWDIISRFCATLSAMWCNKELMPFIEGVSVAEGAMSHSYVWHEALLCVTWLICMCDITHSCVWHETFPFVTWLVSICGMTHFYARYDWVLCVIVLFLRGHEYIPYVTWPIHTCDMMQSYVSYHSSLWVSWLTSMYVVKMRHVTHRNESWHYQPIYVYLYIWCGYD